MLLAYFVFLNDPGDSRSNPSTTEYLYRGGSALAPLAACLSDPLIGTVSLTPSTLPSASPQPPSDNKDPDDRQGAVILSDVLGNQESISIFAGFTRDIDSVSARLDTKTLNTTLLAPRNAAITSLPRKPWEDPRDGANAYDGQAGEDRAHSNLRRFTEAHVISASPWEEGVKEKSLGGEVYWWEKKDSGKVVVMPGSVEVERIVSRVANGEVWLLKGVLNCAE